MTQEEAIKYLQQLYPNGGHCWLDEQRIEAMSMAIKALQEAADNYVGHAQEVDEDLSCFTKRNAFIAGAQWQKEQMVKGVDLEKELIIWHRRHFKKGGTFKKYGGFYLANSSQLDLAKHFFELGLKAQQKGG